jgi:hypothetical protein
MCNILLLKPGQMIPQEDFWNMCYNNWHSYGLITKVDGKLDVQKHVPESGEIDPQVLWDLVKRDIEYERILHVRHNTAGATNIENCHPLPIYYDPKTGKQIEFMHNGTLYQYKSQKLSSTGALVDDPDGPSDTANFATQIIQPLVAGSNFGTGKGDIHNDFFKKIIREFWPSTGNRGILIANDQASFLFGDWKKTKAEDGSDVITANTEYFASVVRGPEHTRREAVKKEAEEKRRRENPGSSTPVGVTRVDLFNFKGQTTPFELPSSVKHIFDDWNVWSREGSAALGCLTKDELAELYLDKDTTLHLMDWVFTDYYNLYEEFLEIEEDKEKATKYIATMAEELKELREYVKSLKEERKAA